RVDALTQAHGQGIIMRGHDFRLRSPPRDAISKAAPRPQLPSRISIFSKPPTPSTYVPLRMHSHYSFLDSTLSPEAIVKLAQRHSLPAVALTDTGNLHGAVEFALAAKDAGVKAILGVELRI